MTKAIRRRPLATFFVICILVNIGIVSLPCETFGVKFTNTERDPVLVRISLDNIDRFPAWDVIWSGRVVGGATEFISTSETIRGNGFSYEFYYPAAGQVEWSNQGWARFPFLPKFSGSFDLRLSLQGPRDETRYEHPFIGAFDSDYWKSFALWGVWYYRDVKCLDCVIRRWFRD